MLILLSYFLSEGQIVRIIMHLVVAKTKLQTVCSIWIQTDVNTDTEIVVHGYKNRGRMNIMLPTYTQGVCGDVVEALRYKTEHRGFDSRWCNWNFSLI